MRVRSLFTVCSALVFVSLSSMQTGSAQDVPFDEYASHDVTSFAGNRFGWHPEPSGSSLSRPVTLWATWYYLPSYKAVSSSNFPLLGSSQKPIAYVATRKIWCNIAVQGSVVLENVLGGVETLNVGAGGTSHSQHDCSDQLDEPEVNRRVFQKASGQYGDGVEGFTLSPFRTIAVDPSLISIGSVVYIPEARGISVMLPDGESVTHDGYFFAADIGSGVRGNHIDVFMGTARENPFDFVKSTRNGTFSGYVVRDSKIIAALREQHGQ
jgi:3D (Asp-Asp-Asp) domain-containing protein